VGGNRWASLQQIRVQGKRLLSSKKGEPSLNKQGSPHCCLTRKKKKMGIGTEELGKKVFRSIKNVAIGGGMICEEKKKEGLLSSWVELREKRVMGDRNLAGCGKRGKEAGLEENPPKRARRGNQWSLEEPGGRLE